MVKVFDFGISDVSFLANETLAAYQYYFVESAGSAAVGSVALANSGSATYSPLGVVQNEPASGDEATVRMMGSTKVVAAAPGTQILCGHWVTCNGSGQAAYTSVASLACGFALSNSDSSASSIIEMFFDPGMSWLTRKV